MTPTPARLVDRSPQVRPEDLVAELVPPPRFREAAFETYLPDPAEPTQAAAVSRLRQFAADTSALAEAPPRSGWRALVPQRAPAAETPAAVYLDGGFGVGKTHLLASLWRAVPGPKAFGTFVEYTNLVGALGFRPAVAALTRQTCVCIDEFELDDPGDTLLVARLVRELVDAGVRLGATSNTLPGSLGEDRFAAEDFVREIQGLAEHFEVVRVDGEDYRHRGLPTVPPPATQDLVRARAADVPGATLDDYDALVAHLSQLHPSRYGALVQDVPLVCLTGVRPVPDQAVALRLVVLVDRLYDRDIPVLASGVPLDQLFGPEMMRGGYRKKYARALSRLTALAREAGTGPPAP